MTSRQFTLKNTAAQNHEFLEIEYEMLVLCMP
jgi:hypothetical protein